MQIARQRYGLNTTERYGSQSVLYISNLLISRHIGLCFFNRANPETAAEVLEEIKKAMYNALGMTDDQITTLENIREDFRTDLEILRDEYIDGTNNHTADEYRSAVVSIISGNHNRRESVFTQEQKEIIEIHRALTRRYMKHTQWGKRG